MGVVAEVEAEVSGVEVGADVASAAAEEGGAAVFCNLLSSETFPMWTGNVNMTSGDFRLT